MSSRRYASPTSVSIAVLTYKRNAAIDAMLPHLVEQTRLVDMSADVVVVDNDPEAGAREIVSAFADQGVRYVHEPEPGIAYARNCALSAATNSDLLVFIDDDELPSPQWLPLLLQTFGTFDCVGVVGNVKRAFDVEPDDWIIAGGFFDKPTIPTGTAQPAASTANLLLDLRFVREHELQFDPVFGLSGGSDTLFTREIVKAGGRLVWCAEALVTEQIPANRTTHKWVVRRHFRVGNADSQTALALAQSPLERTGRRLESAAQGIVRVLGGSARRIWGKATHNLAHDARGMRTLARGAGKLSGAFGYHYDREYRQMRAATQTVSNSTPAATHSITEGPDGHTR